MAKDDPDGFGNNVFRTGFGGGFAFLPIQIPSDPDANDVIDNLDNLAPLRPLDDDSVDKLVEETDFLLPNL